VATTLEPFDEHSWDVEAEVVTATGTVEKPTFARANMDPSASASVSASAVNCVETTRQVAQTVEKTPSVAVHTAAIDASRLVPTQTADTERVAADPADEALCFASQQAEADAQVHALVEAETQRKAALCVEQERLAKAAAERVANETAEKADQEGVAK
jgi:hypothetical protein